MKKIKLKEEELVTLIEKLVKENLGNGNGTNFGMMGTPTAKYKEMMETEEVEEDIFDMDESIVQEPFQSSI